MSYTSLYRKFRPTGFEDVKGQDHIVKTIKNQINANRIGHAYLFVGTRGTGKTTIAKILARAVNCEHPTDSSPCNECAVCRSILKQTSMNVIEIDAASNNGVDNIRDIINEVQYSPTEGKYKVYIIDEVHMLSAGAFNALLKTLEEPPAYVIFVLATTEVHKIPITILSRCQRYDFHRITIDTIAERMKELMEIEGISVEEKALKYIAKAADGSMRDGLSLLDQCIAFYLGETLTYDKVLEVLGAVDLEVFDRLLKQVQNQNVVAVIEMIEELIVSGRDLSQFVVDFTWYLRNLMLIKTSDQALDILEMSSENQSLLMETATLIDLDTLFRFIRIFSELANQMKYASQKRVVMEVACIKLCRPQMETDFESILQRLKSIEKQVEQGVVTISADREKVTDTKIVEENVKATIDVKALPEDVREVAKNWMQIIHNIKQPLQTYLSDAKLTVGEGNNLIIAFDNETAYGLANFDDKLSTLTNAVSSFVGKQVEIQLKYVDNKNDNYGKLPDLSKIINMKNIEVVR